jgi:hypothetical protein
VIPDKEKQELPLERGKVGQAVVPAVNWMNRVALAPMASGVAAAELGFGMISLQGLNQSAAEVATGPSFFATSPRRPTPT